MVAGVPADYFSKDGQKWGNPLYDWAKMEKDGYKWWKRRISFYVRFVRRDKDRPLPRV